MLIREPLPLYQEDSAALRELPTDLLARAAFLGAADGAIASPNTTPEDPGVFSFLDTYSAEEDVIFTVLGERIWDVNTQLSKKEYLSQVPVSLGVLATKASISTKTGCWSLLDEDIWRDEKGYAFTWHPEAYGYKVEKLNDFRGVKIHRMAYNMKLRAQGLPDLTSHQHLDHVCRWTGCCNIDHLEKVSPGTNNKLRDAARRFEAAIIAGQLIVGPIGRSGKTEIDTLLHDADTEFTNILIATVAGPHRLVKVEHEPLIFRAEKEHCELVETVASPAPKKYERPSRAKKPKILDGQHVLFGQDQYSGKRLKKANLYKQWQKTDKI